VRSYGYPGVCATNANGGQLGRAAEREPNPKPEPVTIPAGGTAHAYFCRSTKYQSSTSTCS
jgi:hypothetical protein